MFVNNNSILLVSSPFYQAYVNSDFLGKMIFLALLFTSICCWSIFIHKFFLTKQAKKNAEDFQKTMKKHKGNPLNLEAEPIFRKKAPNPFFDLFLVLKKHTIDLLNKNHHFSDREKETSFLCASDIDYIESHLLSTITSQTNKLEKNLYILSLPFFL